MSKKKTNQQKPVAQPAKPQPIPDQKQQRKPDAIITKAKVVSASGNKLSPELIRHFYFIGGIIIITWLFLSVCLHDQFTNWDDPGYVKNNPVVKNISADGLRDIFTTSIMGNYHPITILTYALEYSAVDLKPWLYHFDSLLFHLLTTIAVYFFVFLLTRKPIAGAICALLFGLHPMHIESVAWIAGRKDVVYGFFYMMSMIFYLLYIRDIQNKKWVWYGVTILLFILSILSKPVAVSLPIALFAIDYFEKRNVKVYPVFKGKYDAFMLIEKLPFFAISVFAGIKSISDQRQFGALNSLDVKFNFLERIALGAYALCTYLWKAIVPLKLSCFYPYPEKENDILPVNYFIYPVIALVLLIAVIIFLRKNKAVIFGLLFFIINIALLLQFIPVGGAIVADRYSYIPFMGLFFIPAWYIAQLFDNEQNKQYRLPSIGIIGAYCLFLGYQSHEKCIAWYDSVSLWRDEIAEHPNTPNAYNNLGFNYFDMFNNTANPKEKQLYYDSAYYLLSKAIELQPKFVNPYISLGELERSIGKFDDAKRHYYKAMSLDPKEANLYLGLAIVYSINQRFDSAGYCFRTALTLKPFFPEAHSNYGNFLDMTGKYDSSLQQYTLAVVQDPDAYAPYLNRGRALMNRMKRYDDAMKDFEKAMEIMPDNGEIYYARATLYAVKGNKQMAIQDVNKAVSLGFTQMDKNFVESLKH